MFLDYWLQTNAQHAHSINGNNLSGQEITKMSAFSECFSSVLIFFKVGKGWSGSAIGATIRFREAQFCRFNVLSSIFSHVLVHRHS